MSAVVSKISKSTCPFSSFLIVFSSAISIALLLPVELGSSVVADKPSLLTTKCNSTEESNLVKEVCLTSSTACLTVCNFEESI